MNAPATLVLVHISPLHLLLQILISTTTPLLLDAVHPRHVYAYQREIVREERQPDPAAVHATTMVAAPAPRKQQTIDYLICDKGKPIAGICVCEQGYVGKFCERKMHCQDYDRVENGSCVECTEMYTGPNCDHPICQNGGVEMENSDTCQCAAPYSGQFCHELKMEDVYYFYNSKAAIIGPLGILLIVPMIFCFYMCEKHARRRQVNRIQRAWANEENKKKLDGKRIESLLK